MIEVWTCCTAHRRKGRSPQAVRIGNLKPADRAPAKPAMPHVGRAAIKTCERVLCAATVLSVWLSGCTNDAAYGNGFPNDQQQYAQFQQSVYPVLLRDCAFSACHGGEHRFFQLYGPGRVRLDPQLKPADPATDAEIMLSFTRAVSMLATDSHVDRSLLLTKPLEPSAGGQGHKGIDLLGRNVYASKLDPDYVTIANWGKSVIRSQTAGAIP